MDVNAGISGAIGGFFIAIVTALGLKQSVDKKLDKDVFEQFLLTCDIKHKIVEDLKDDTQYIKQRVDELNNYLRNHHT